ncbi:MAG: hypothetical protein MUQ25_04075 [Candidatus Aminicenantes bacterium]|nr:hypothetical protein [Candidatus Aminicenantes bacterium]
MRKVSARLVSFIVLGSLFLVFFAGLTFRAYPQGTATQKVLPKQKAVPNQPPKPKADSVPQFKIGLFTVVVGTGRSPADPRSVNPEARTPIAPPATKTAAGLSGQGRITIRGQRVPVAFSDITLAQAAKGQPPVATSGTVKGTAGAPLEYNLDGFKVKIERPSIRITPDTATAVVGLSLVQAPFMAPGRDNALTLSSEACNFAPDGSITSANFRGPCSFLLKDTVYRLTIPAEMDQRVRLGTNPQAPTGRRDPTLGCALKGISSFDGTDLFSFEGSILPGGKASDFVLVMLAPPVLRIPEPGYDLTLHGGTVSYRHAADGVTTCDGEIRASVKFPPAVRGFDQQSLELRELALKTDATGALFNRITIPGPVRAAFVANRPSDAVFLIDPQPEAVWLYFPKWQSPVPHSSYPMLQGHQKITDVKPNCGDLIHFLESPAPGSPMSRNAPEKNVLRRPGATILQGTLYFKSPQAKFKTMPPAQPAQPAAAEFNLKTVFYGGLTLTPWGLTGTLTSSGNSLVPSFRPIEECANPSGASRPTWAEILDAGARRPREPEERFQLAGLRVLEMRVENLLLCANELPAHGASMCYIVHFPFPSFIDLDFADESLDPRGRFNSAAGPLASKSWAFPRNPTRADLDAALAGDLKKGTQEVLNPDTHILWQWRLPVSFSDRGVTITYMGTSQANVNVTMKPYASDVPPIMSSEIWLRPLFSRNSGVKAGVRFAARLDPEGGFVMTNWDMEPLTFGKLYASPGTEKTVGFECRLDPVSERGISLVDPSSNAATRPADFSWEGSLVFPFFGARKVSFLVKDLEPDMPAPIAEMSARDQAQALTATVRDLRYSKTSYPFRSTDATGVWSGTDFQDDFTYFSSFTCAAIHLPAPGRKDVTIPLHSTTDGCGGTKSARHMLKDAVFSDSIIDLVCYDPGARAARGLPDTCGLPFWQGTYEVSTGQPGAEKVTFTATNAKWYPDVIPVSLKFNSSDAVLSSDEVDNPHKTFINIPGAGLKQDERGALVGSFGATMTSLASSLPYEGEFRFYLDPNCGYFYLLSGGSFTYYARFSGEVFIVHAPYRLVKRPPDFIGETRLLETLSIRALFSSVGDFEKKTGLSRITDDNTVVSGFFQAGNASKSFGFDALSVNLALGAGTYVFQFRAPSGSTSYCFGTFQNGIAAASLLLASAVADISLAQGPVTTGSLASLEEFFGRAELEASGTFLLCACATIELAHLELIARGDATFSTKSGLHLSGRLRPQWGLGGCSPCR